MAKLTILAIAVASFAFAYSLSPYDELRTLPNRPTMVHLFEWKWTDIAKECETYLTRYNYGSVQVSPPNEHIMLDINGNVPWYVRYQPISYKLKSRSGTEEEFIDMVNRCNKVGIRIIVDAVVNHMTGRGHVTGQPGKWSTAGSFFNATVKAENYPGVPFTSADFNDVACDGNIPGSAYDQDSRAVRNCRLSGLLDLDQGTPNVRYRISQYFNRLMDIGVGGIRIDAAKHMWPADIQIIVDMTKNLREDIFGPNQRPFIVQEVIDRGGQAIKGDEYLNSGRITNFKYGADLTNAVKKDNHQNFKFFYNFGIGWGYWPDNSVLNFVDNHDNQRDSHDVLIYKDGSKYIMGVAYMLAWPYGYARVMSSYYFNDLQQGPPTSGKFEWITKSPYFNPDETCKPESGFVCEHRWPSIRRMAVFRGVTDGQAAANIVTDHHRIAFRRGQKGFFALNNNDFQWENKFYTGLPQGTYCDVISGEYNGNNGCTGTSVNVDGNGEAFIKLQSGGVLAIHIDQRVGGPTPINQSPPLPSSFQRTVIMIRKESGLGQNVFVRGGRNGGAFDESSIPIVHKTEVAADQLPYLYWKQSDVFLDWFGREFNQGTWDGILAEGTPMVWTTNDSSKRGYHPLSRGQNYWLVDLMMDCSKTNNGWFNFKGFLKTSLNDGGEEEKVGQHSGQCGSITVCIWGQTDCQVNRF